jgi:hypothetical protein
MLLLNNRKYQIMSINKDQFLDPRKMSQTELKSLGHVKKPLSKIIREMCNSCVGADPSGARSNEVTLCQATGCPLWAYRMGKSPFSTRGAMSDEQKKIVAERFANARNAKK